MSVLPDFRLETYFSRWEFAAKYHMTASDAESLSIAELLDLAGDNAREVFEATRLGYTETFGAPDLRAAIAATYERRSAADILCFAGIEEGLYAAMHCLLDSGDHAIVATPNYQSAETVPCSICAVTGVGMDPADNWSLDIDAVAAAIRPNTKVISVNFPHNPTGKVLERDRFDALVALCRKHGVYLFSDEVYRLLGPPGKTLLPQAADVYERAISINVLSKAYGLPGLRIGWAACQDRALLGRMERFKHYLSICNSAPSERLAVLALGVRARILARNNAIVARNLELLRPFFAEFPHLFAWYEPDGGCVAYPRYLGAEGVDQWAEKLVERTGVLFLAAGIYRSELTQTPQDRFRIGFGRRHVPDGINVLRDDLLRSGR